MDQNYIGVDVAKAWLDIYHPARGAKRIENTLPSVRSFARAAAREGVWVIFEASGGYDRVLRDGLEAAQASFSLRQPPSGPRFCVSHGGDRQDRPCRCPDARDLWSKVAATADPARLTDAAGTSGADYPAPSIG